jgi:hypothetical protein
MTDGTELSERMELHLHVGFPKQAMEMTEYGKHGKPRSRLKVNLGAGPGTGYC